MAQEQTANSQQQIQVKITDEVLKGLYSNQAMIRHGRDEFIIDFLNYVPGDSSAIDVARVILSPSHFKGLLAAVQDNLSKYEDQFGKIKEFQAPEHKIGFKTE